MRKDKSLTAIECFFSREEMNKYKTYVRKTKDEILYNFDEMKKRQKTIVAQVFCSDSLVSVDDCFEENDVPGRDKINSGNLINDNEMLCDEEPEIGSEVLGFAESLNNKFSEFSDYWINEDNRMLSKYYEKLEMRRMLIILLSSYTCIAFAKDLNAPLGTSYFHSDYSTF